MPKRKRARSSATDLEGGGIEVAQSVSYGGRVDPVFGQRSAIPGLDYEEESDGGRGEENGREGPGEEEGEDGGSDVEYYGVDIEALRYLRSVREEASSIPTVLVAPKTRGGGRDGEIDVDMDGEEVMDRGVYANGVGDSRGWYEDGAYTAAPTTPPPRLYGSAAWDEENGGGGRDAQGAYYESLIARFEALRERLAHAPPRHAVERLGPDHGSYMSRSAKDHKLWKWRLGHTAPKPAQLAAMDKETVLRLLRMVGARQGARFLGLENLVGDGAGESRRRVSAWVWGLLARLPGRGELVSEEVGIMRELGKRAVWVGVEMKGVDMAGLERQMGEGGDDNGDGGNEDEEGVDIGIDDEDALLDPEASLNSLPNGNKVQSRNDPYGPASFLTPPIIGPISPKPPRRHASLHLNSTTTITTITDNKTVSSDPSTRDSTQASNISNNEEQEQALLLATARACLLARLGSPPASQADHRAPTTPTPRKSSAANSEQGKAERDDGEEGGGKGSDGEREDEQGNEDGEMEEEEQDAAAAMRDAKALLDMIVTVAGEVYGQRDLLEFREVWE